MNIYMRLGTYFSKNKKFIKSNNFLLNTRIIFFNYVIPALRHSNKNDMLTRMQNKSPNTPSRQAFTLIELSIVIAIIGLLVGGILGGQTLIRNAELKSIISDLNKYKAAATQFKDQYGGLPGDLVDASSYWVGANNGNGDGQLNFPAAANVTGETFEFWRQLASASLIVGTYSGTAGSGGARHAVVGANVPASRINKVGFYIEYVGLLSSDPWRWNGDYGHAMYIGLQTTSVPSEGLAFKPDEVWNLDTKIDDGNPATGNIRPFRKNSAGNCTTTDVEATTAYNVSYNSSACNIVAISGF